jgi:hypothetical protein
MVLPAKIAKKIHFKIKIQIQVHRAKIVQVDGNNPPKVPQPASVSIGKQ